MNKISQQRKT